MITKIKEDYLKFKNMDKADRDKIYVKAGLFVLVTLSLISFLILGSLQNQSIDTLREEDSMDNFDFFLSNFTIQNTSATLFVCDEMKKFQKDNLTLSQCYRIEEINNE